VGKTADLTVLIILKKVGRVSKVQYIETHKRTDSAGLQDMVDRAFRKFSLRKLCVDATGMGSFPADDMRAKHGYYQVEPVNFGLKSKEELATGLYSALNERAVLLPGSDHVLPKEPDGMHSPQPGVAKWLKEDLCSLRRIVTKAGNVRYDAPHTDAGHADRAWALALSVRAAADVTQYSSADNLGAMF
jgi:phage FluMu gp28-like protein